jgi:hypothetical protein
VALNVGNDDATLNIDLAYQVIATGEEKQLRFQHAG